MTGRIIGGTEGGKKREDGEDEKGKEGESVEEDGGDVVDVRVDEEEREDVEGRRLD